MVWSLWASCAPESIPEIASDCGQRRAQRKAGDVARMMVQHSVVPKQAGVPRMGGMAPGGSEH